MKTTITCWAAALLLLLSNTLLSGQTHADRTFRQGQKVVWVGVGIIPTYLMDDNRIILPPVTFGGDLMMTDNLSLGAQFGYSVSGFDKYFEPSEQTRNYQNSSYFFGIRGAAHCTKFSNLDIYGGFNLGYNVTNFKALNGEFGRDEASVGMKERDSKVTYTGFMGVKYVCCSNVGLFGEIGFGASLLMIGLTYQF